MRPWICIWLILAGCSGSAEPARPPLAAQPGTNAPNLYAGAGATGGLDAAGEPTFRGLNLEQWVEQIQTPDPAGHQQAVQALGQLGPPGYAKLIDVAQHHRSPETRVMALQAIQLTELVENSKDTVPMLLRMMHDKSPLIRQAAALRLAWFDRTESGGDKLRAGYQADERIRALEVAAQDANPYVRETARDSLAAVRSAKTGTVASD